MTQRDELPIEIELVRGATYVPSNAVNPTQMWTEFDPVTIDRELGFAEELGLNSDSDFERCLGRRVVEALPDA